MGNSNNAEDPHFLPLNRHMIESGDLDYVQHTISKDNYKLECVPRNDGRGTQMTPLGWAIYYDSTNKDPASRKIIRHLILNTLCPVDPTFVCARWYDSVFPESSLTPLMERVAPSISFERTIYQCNALDFAIMFGNHEVVAEFMNLSIAWSRKFQDPVGYALDLAQKFLSWASGSTEGIEEAPRKIIASDEEKATYTKIIQSLKRPLTAETEIFLHKETNRYPARRGPGLTPTMSGDSDLDEARDRVVLAKKGLAMPGPSLRIVDSDTGPAKNENGSSASPSPPLIIETEPPSPVTERVIETVLRKRSVSPVKRPEKSVSLRQSSQRLGLSSPGTERRKNSALSAKSQSKRKLTHSRSLLLKRTISESVVPPNMSRVKKRGAPALFKFLYDAESEFIFADEELSFPPKYNSIEEKRLNKAKHLFKFDETPVMADEEYDS